jgi:uncharacterized protein with beta-barrel porin domain
MMKREVSQPFARHRLSMLGLALMATPLAIIGEAQALCTPPGPAIGQTINCTLTTSDPSIGYGSFNDDNNTYNIGTSAVPNATVTGGLIAFETGTGYTFNNFGIITGTTNQGISAGADSIGTINNNVGASIIGGATAVTGQGLSVININNAGLIRGSGLGIDAATVNVSANSGTIDATGVNGIAINSVGTINIVSNSGTISALGINGQAIKGDAVTVSNSQTIKGGLEGIVATTLNVTANSGLIQAIDGLAISAVTISNLANSGTIRANGGGNVAIFGTTINNLSNSGTIEATGAGGEAITSVGSVTITANSGLISGGSFGIDAATAVNVNANSGTIEATGTDGRAISANSGTVTNSVGGTIQANGLRGIAVQVTTTATVTNNGTIQANGVDGKAFAGGTINLVNSGFVKATGAGGIAFDTINGTLTNSGTISASDVGISALNFTVANSGLIEATSANTFMIGVDNLRVDNSGIIRATGANAEVIFTGSATINNSASGTIAATGTGSTIGILATKGATVVNAGLISGAVGIRANGVGGVGSVITNSGTITGTGGTAIKLSNAADTVTLLPGSRIVGVIDMGGNNADVINAFAAIPASRVSSLTTAPTLPTIINFTGTLNTGFTGSASGPSVQTATQVATLDPTALAQTDRTLMDFTGGASSLVRDRLNGVASANGGMMAMAYAPEAASAGPFTKAPAAGWMNPAPITVWVNSFGGRRVQDETSSTLRATSTAWGAAMGIDRRLQPDWLVGAYIGGGSGSLSVDLNSQSVNTDYLFAGGYSRFEWASQFLDVTVQGGSASNKSRRLVLNNSVVAGSETATASYNGWFISPEVAYGFRYGLGNGYVLTPTARLRYVAGLFDGYSETGSAETLKIGSRTLQNLEERGELDLSKVTSFGGEQSLKANVHGGVIALQRVGNANISALLVGQTLAFTTPGKASTVGAVFGAGFDYHTSNNVALFGAVEGMAMSDQSRTATAKGGVRVAF